MICIANWFNLIPVACFGRPRWHHLLGQYSRVLRGVCDLQFHDLSPGGALHGDGPTGSDALKATDQTLFPVLPATELGHGHRVCLQVQTRNSAVRILPADYNSDLSVSWVEFCFCWWSNFINCNLYIFLLSLPWTNPVIQYLWVVRRVQQGHYCHRRGVSLSGGGDEHQSNGGHVLPRSVLSRDQRWYGQHATAVQVSMHQGGYLLFVLVSIFTRKITNAYNRL